MNIKNLTLVLEKFGEGFTKFNPVAQLAAVFGVIVFFALGAAVLPLIFGTAMILIGWLFIVALILQVNKSRHGKVAEVSHESE